jgi:predicted LPLAT superfamily acyltransferase
MAHWSERSEGGGKFAIWLLVSISLRLGRAPARWLLYPITLYFFFRRSVERRQSREFLTRALGRAATAWDVMRHIHAYASTTLDRVFMLAQTTKRFDIRVQGLAGLDAQIALGRGVLLLGAHIGSFEILRVLATERPDIKTRILMDRQQTPALTELLLALNEKVSASIIDVGAEDTNVMLAINEAASEGALIGLLADRSRAREATTTVTFFDRPAEFPVAPYLIASLLDLPVTLIFGLYRGGDRYDLYFETLADHLAIPRRERAALLNEWAAKFAARLEHYTRLDPYNWFNFYDFWHRPDDVAAADGNPAIHAASSRSVA